MMWCRDASTDLSELCLREMGSVNQYTLSRLCVEMMR